MYSGFNNKKNKSSENSYHKPLPIDTINRFWGVDSRILKHDDTVQKQSFDQGYKNFWSFADFNSDNENGSNFLKTFNHNKINSRLTNNASYLSYLEARKRANELLGK